MSTPAWLQPCKYCGEHVEYDQLLRFRSGKVGHIECFREYSRKPRYVVRACGHCGTEAGQPHIEGVCPNWSDAS